MTGNNLDWVRCKTINGTRVCVGVEVRVSAQSDYLVVDMIRLNAAFREGRIDVGIVIVPSDKLSRFLTDRGPRMSDAKKHALNARLEDSSESNTMALGRRYQSRLRKRRSDR
jgi:hypothetical protein